MPYFNFLYYISVTELLTKQHNSCYNAFEVMILFADKLKKLRIEADMSRSELALRLGMSVSSISNYENNIRKPESDEVWIKLANIFNVTVDDLMDVESNRMLNYNGSDQLKQELATLMQNILDNVSNETKLQQIKMFLETYKK